MINDNALREMLLALVDQEKKNYEMICVLANELLALRETIRPLDPAFSDVLEHKRPEFEKANISDVTTVLHSFDELTRRLKAREVC
jgi:hypothetical protein